MKKQFPTVIHESAQEFREIYVSGGRIGTTLKLSPQKLAEVTGAKFAAITAEKNRRKQALVSGKQGEYNNL